jgi:hypothetical protein
MSKRTFRKNKKEGNKGKPGDGIPNEITPE